MPRRQFSLAGFVPPSFRAFGTLAVVVLLCVAGCQRGPKTVPVSGKVIYQEKPLESGTVMFQPDEGPLARGNIQPDGTFQLTTLVDGDGCTEGPVRVRIACFGSSGAGNLSADSAEDEVPAGTSLIPKRYTSFGTSGLRAEVRADGEPFVFELNDEPGPGFSR